jgi:hypothetical protein
MPSEKPKGTYHFKSNVGPGLIGVIVGLLVAVGIPEFGKLEGDVTLYRVIGAILIFFGLVVMRVWPWSAAQMLLESGAVTYRRRSGGLAKYTEIADVRYFHSLTGNRRLEMILFVARAPSGKKVSIKISRRELEGDFVAFAYEFHGLFGEKDSEGVDSYTGKKA